jgi:RHS repeat-associated protein
MRRAIVVTFSVLRVLFPTLPVTAQVSSMRMTVPSPTAASLGKFGDVPVSLYTGVPDITIPLFTAKSRTLELPIVLRYHAGGIKVEEIGGWAGIGWTLEAGGAITRTVRGTADEHLGGYYHTGHTFYNDANWPNPPPSLLENIRNRSVDGEPDQFFFSFAGRSGQFVIGPTSTSTSVKEHRTIPFEKLRIEPFFGASNFISHWVITTEDGTRYTFAAPDTTTDYTVSTSGYGGENWGDVHHSSWHLTEIRSPGGDAITLHYTTYVATHRMGWYQELFTQRWWDPPWAPACVPNQFDSANEYQIRAQRLDSIKTAAHTVKFSTTLRSDALGPAGAQEPRLDRIMVTTPTASVLRVFRFEHDYVPGRLRLKNVYEQDRNGVALPPYSFAYDGQTLPPRDSYAQDHWGFYNGRTNNSPIPKVVQNGVEYPGANREPDSVAMRAGVLTKITYPTGGSTEFFYGPNDFGYVRGSDPTSTVTQSTRISSGGGSVNRPFTVGGMSTVSARVWVSVEGPSCGPQDWPCPYIEIRNAQMQTLGHWETTGEYNIPLAPGEYTLIAYAGLDRSAGGSVTWDEVVVMKRKMAGGLRLARLNTADAMGNVTVRKYIYTLQSDPERSSGLVGSEPMYAYTKSGGNCGYFSRSSMSRLPLGAGPQVSYSQVTVWHGANGEYGKTRHTFRQGFDSPSEDEWPVLRVTTTEWKRGQHLEAIEYNASAQVQRRVASTYRFRDEDAEPETTRRFRGVSMHAFGTSQATGYTYAYRGFEVFSAWAYEDTETTVVYDETGGNSFSTSKTFVYGNPTHAQLTEVTETNSDGIQRITRMKHPADYATGSGNAEAVALTAMQGTANMHSAVIERWVIKRVGAADSVVQAQLTSFKQYAPGRYLPYQLFALNNPTALTTFVPSSVTSGSFTKDSRYLRQETADSYDGYGRINQLTDPRDKVTTYQYNGGPNNAFPSKATRVHDGTGAIDLVTDIAYNTDGFVSSIKDEGGTFRYFYYDLYGRLDSIRNNANTKVKAYGYTYSRTSANGWVFQPGSPNAVIDSTFLQLGTSVVSTQYLDGLGRPIQTVVKDGTNYHVNATQYDLMGRTWRVWKPYTRNMAGFDAGFAANATAFYNTYHSTTTAKPYTETAYTPDALARVKQVTPEYIGTTPTAMVVHAYGLDVPTKQAYTEVTDEALKRTRTNTDVFGNVVRSVLGSGTSEATTTTFLANVLGQRVQATDPRGLVTTYAFDTRGLQTARTSPDAGTASSKYDKAGNLRFSQDANQAGVGKVSFTTYDFANRPLVSGEAAATFASLSPDVSQAFESDTSNWLVVRAYDAKPSPSAGTWDRFGAQITPLTLANVSGRLAAVGSKSNGARQITLFRYDADGEVATRYTYTQANGGGSVLTALNTTATYTRDLRGALTQRALTVGTNTFYHWYDYNSRGLLWKTFASTTGTKPGTPDVTDTYRPSGQPHDYQFQGSPLVPIRYTIREQTEKIGDPDTVGTYAFSARYAYQRNGVVDTAEFYNGGLASGQRYRYVFGPSAYDALNRLKSADFWAWTGAWSVSPNYDLPTIGYDAAGNITALQRRNNSGVLIDNLTYNYLAGTNRLGSLTETPSTPSPELWDAEAGSFTYDANGNVKSAPAPYSITTVAPIIYDHRNLPVSITRSGVTTTYRYDDAGQRITKQGTGNTELYLREGPTTLGVFTVDGAGAPVSWYFNILWEDQVVGRHTGPGPGTRTYYHNDILGSTRAVVLSTTGAVVESYDFEPWGLLMPGRTLGSGTKEGFTGKEQDAETGLDYFGARYYMPALGRWAGVDPLAGEYPEWSPYNYAVNDPFAVTDPDGRQAGGTPNCTNWTGPCARAALAGVDRKLEPVRGPLMVASTIVTALPTMGAGALANLGGRATIALELGTSAVDVLATSGPDLQQRADELHDALPDQIARDKRTTAVGDVEFPDGSTERWAASSQERLAPQQRAVLQPGEMERPTRGVGPKGHHAEMRLVDGAESRGGRLVRVATSPRPPCPNCEKTLLQKAVAIMKRIF